MKEYKYNPHPLVNGDSEFKSFEEVRSSEKWKSDNGKYAFQEHIPAYCEGFDYHIFTFESIEELLEFFAGEYSNCLLKLQMDSYEDFATLMEYRWNKDEEEEMDASGEEYLKRNLGDKWKDYNWWWVLGYVYHKDGSPVSKEECVEIVCE